MASAFSYNPLTGLPTKTPNTQQTPTLPPDFFKPGATLAPPASAGNLDPFQNFGSTINYGAFEPDYKALIANDPGFLQAQQALSAGGIADASGRDAAFRRAYVQAGLPIDLSGAAAALGLDSGALSGIIDQNTQQLAQKNTDAGLSTEARLQQARKDAVRGLRNALAARGALRSGELGYGLNREQQQFQQGEYDAQQKLQDYFASYQQGFLQAQQQRQQELAQAAQDAASRQMGLPQNQPSPGTTAVFAGYTGDGRPYYRAPDGTLHLQDGSVYAGAAAAPPTPSSGNRVANLPQITGTTSRLGPGAFQAA